MKSGIEVSQETRCGKHSLMAKKSQTERNHVAAGGQHPEEGQSSLGSDKKSDGAKSGKE